MLNEASEWKTDAEIISWFSKQVLGTGPREANSISSESPILQRFKSTLFQIRRTVYDFHFELSANLEWLKSDLRELQLDFDLPPQDLALAGLPLLLSGSFQDSANWQVEEKALERLRGAVLLDFAFDLSKSMGQGKTPCAQRCEGLYRDQAAAGISMLPEIGEDMERCWRSEIEILKENSLESDSSIQRCLDLFSADSRSRFCSDKCRFNTFQIVKQIKDPGYLAEKQKRYRLKKGQQSSQA